MWFSKGQREVRVLPSNHQWGFPSASGNFSQQSGSHISNGTLRSYIKVSPLFLPFLQWLLAMLGFHDKGIKWERFVENSILRIWNNIQRVRYIFIFESGLGWHLSYSWDFYTWCMHSFPKQASLLTVAGMILKKGIFIIIRKVKKVSNYSNGQHIT